MIRKKLVIELQASAVSRPLEAKVYMGSNATISGGKFSKKDRLDNFLKACKAQNKEFSYADMQANSDLSDSPLRGYLTGYLKEIIKESSKGSRGKILYKCL